MRLRDFSRRSCGIYRTACSRETCISASWQLWVSRAIDIGAELSSDLIDSAARVSELSRLVSELPPPNYALLRALTAHLILIVRNSSTNKMTLRNIGIVFCPTLSIPAGIFSELVSHFGPIFDDNPVAAIVPDSEESATEDAEETVKRKRNSMLYQAGGADAMLGLGGRHLEPGESDARQVYTC